MVGKTLALGGLALGWKYRSGLSIASSGALSPLPFCAAPNRLHNPLV